VQLTQTVMQDCHAINLKPGLMLPSADYLDRVGLYAQVTLIALHNIFVGLDLLLI